jgi:hypothetical protein
MAAKFLQRELVAKKGTAMGRRRTAYFQLLGKLIYATAFFIIVVGIIPEETAFVLKGRPGLKITDAGDLATSSSMHAFYHPVEFLDRDWFSNDLIVVF